jgi:anti-sigma-K factor RskA
VDIQEIISSGLLELYVAGLTSTEETAMVVSYMKLYPEIKAAVQEIEISVEALAQAEAITPDKSLKAKIFAALPLAAPIIEMPLTIPPENKIVQMQSYWKWVAAASILLVLGSGLLNYQFYQQNNLLGKNLQQLQEELSVAKVGLKGLKQDLNIVQSKYSEPIKLNGLNETPDAVAKIFWLKNTGEVYIDPSNLPDPPTGKQLQLWAIVDGKPVDAGLILTSSNGSKMKIQKMKTFGRAQAFAITIEQAGGSVSPTMNKMVVMGKM